MTIHCPKLRYEFHGVTCFAYNDEQADALYNEYKTGKRELRSYIWCGELIQALFDDSHEPEAWQKEAMRKEQIRQAAKNRYIDRYHEKLLKLAQTEVHGIK